jgi:anti-sigma B factor antagonist
MRGDRLVAVTKTHAPSDARLTPLSNLKLLGSTVCSSAMAAYELELREAAVGAVALVELAGEVDLTNADELEKRLTTVAADSAGLVIDLNRVTFLDSAALHVLFRVGRRLDGEGKSYGIVINSSAPVAKTLELVRLADAATIAGTLDAVLPDRSS